MKYLIGGSLFLFGLLITGAASYCVILGIYGAPMQFILAVPLYMVAVVAFLASSAAFNALKDW